MATKPSNLFLRVAVAVVAIPLIIFICLKGGVFFFMLVTGISLLSLYEFYGLAASKGARPQIAIGLIGAVALNAAFFHEHIQYSVLPLVLHAGAGISLLTKLQLYITVLFLLLTLIVLIELFRNKGSVFLNAGYTILGVIVIGVFLSTFIGIRELFGREFPLSLAMEHGQAGSPLTDETIRSVTYSWGGYTAIAILATIWMCDTAAYFGGLATGKHKLFPRVSPNKTWEGAVWGFIAAPATMLLARQLVLPYLRLHQAIIIGVIIGVFGQIGDLVESSFKRDAGVKDSSSIIPGHGGVYDRFDSLIFVSPILYLYIDFVVLS